MFKTELGKHGEDIACNYLIQTGYKIVERNFRTRSGEIDIVATKSGTLSFIEVKTRNNLNFGLPFEAVNRKKIKKIRTASIEYLQNKTVNYSELSFDVVSIIMNNTKNAEIEHIKGAF
jgi:putative endonuclease